MYLFEKKDSKGFKLLVILFTKATVLKKKDIQVKKKMPSAVQVKLLT